MVELAFMTTTALANIAVVIGVVVAVMQLRKMRISNELQQREFLADHERRKKQSTIEFAHQILEERVKATKQINTVFTNGRIINVDDNDYKDNDEVKKAVDRYLNLMERFSVGINIGVYDLDVFIRITGRATVSFYKRIEPIILQKRRESGSRTVYCDFEELVNKVIQKKSENDPLIIDDSAKIVHS